MKLGREYVDTITGFAGIAVAVTKFLDGTRSVKLERPDVNGTPEEVWFMECRLAVPAVQARVVGIAQPSG